MNKWKLRWNDPGTREISTESGTRVTILNPAILWWWRLNRFRVCNPVTHSYPKLIDQPNIQPTLCRYANWRFGDGWRPYALEYGGAGPASPGGSSVTAFGVLEGVLLDSGSGIESPIDTAGPDSCYYITDDSPPFHCKIYSCVTCNCDTSGRQLNAQILPHTNSTSFHNGTW